MEAQPRAVGSHSRRSKAIVGRKEELDFLIRQATIRAESSTLICIIGAGGSGKTCLLEAFTDYLEEKGLPSAPLIDFYHIDNFQAEVIEDLIVSGVHRFLDVPQDMFFEDYRQARQRLEDARSSGLNFLDVQRRVRDSFVACYNELAKALAQEERRIVLVFDTVEQAVSLSDGADRLLDPSFSDPSAGGEIWLLNTLPRLENTLVVLGGRTETLYGQPVKLYDDLAQKLRERHTISLGGLDYQNTVKLAHQMQADVCSLADEQMVQIARSLDLDDPTKLRAWYEVSQGQPFWVAVLLTLELIGGEPEGVLSELQEEVSRLPHDASLSEERREALRAKLRECFLGSITRDAPPLLIALQCMASLRKGLTPDLLARLLDRLDIPQRSDPNLLFERLRQLPAVKVRQTQRYTSRGDRPGDPDDRETLLFLHDELYAWLDAHPPVSDESRQKISRIAREWYKEAIEQTEREYQKPLGVPLALDANAPLVAQREAERNDARRRMHQLQRDLLGYVYATDTPSEAAAHLYLLSYDAIFARDAGHAAALHQEALRNLYRLGMQSSTSPLRADDELAFAALWILRMAVQYEDLDQTRILLERLGSLQAQREQASGATAAFFELAIAIARLFVSSATRAEERDPIQKAFEQACRKAEEKARVDRDRPGPVEQRWLRLLKSQIFNFWGYFHRRNYELYSAVSYYRQSITQSRRDPNPPFPVFYATTLNNLGFALAEQGDTEEAERVVREALMTRLQYGTPYSVAYTRAVLARVLLRAGEPFRARHYAELAAEYMRARGDARGLLHVLPILAEAYRKVGELLDDAPLEQNQIFQRGLDVLDEAERALMTLQRPPNERKWLIFQTRGCLYRSWGVVLQRRGERFAAKRADDREHDEVSAVMRHASEHFGSARYWLRQALVLARNAHEPALVQMDMLEDLAAVYVRQDQYDDRLFRLLDEAEALAPEEYRVQEGLGPVEVERATRGYWRELGQCQLQRMLGAFGKFDFGWYKLESQLDLDRITKVKRSFDRKGDKEFLDEAAKHFVLMMAYLYRYNRHSWMLVTARRLTIRELLLRTKEDLDRFALAAYETARRYNLLYDESFAIAEQVIDTARANLDVEREES